MGLITSISEIQAYVNISKNYNIATLQPFIDLAEQEYIEPLISQEFYQELVTANAGNPTGNVLKVINLVKGALANYAMFEAAPHINTHVSELGIQQSFSDEYDSSRPATNQAANKLEQSYQRNGYRFADKVLQFLEANHSDFQTWVESDAFTLTRENFINSKSEYQKFIYQVNSLKTYQALKPHVKNAELQYIEPVLGTTLFDALKAAIVAEINGPTPITQVNADVIEKIKPVVAYYSMLEALSFLPLEIKGNGLYIIETPNSSSSRSSSDYRRTEAIRIEIEKKGKFYLEKLKNFMQENADTYPDYKSESDSYVENTNDDYRTRSDNSEEDTSFWV